MRERKYRAWISNLQEYVYSENFEKLSDFFEEIYPLNRNADALEDWIGLSDKHGIDVYEGDIICNEDSENKGVVIYRPKEACYEAVWLNDYVQCPDKQGGMINDTGDDWMMNKCAVIGFIHIHQDTK